MDVNKPVENPELVVAIENLQNNPSAETEKVIFECLKQANFLIVLQDKLEHDEPDEDGKVVLKEKTTISFPMLSIADGQQMHFGFTDWPSIYAWRNEPDIQTIILSFNDMAHLVLKGATNSAGFLVNGSTHDFFIPRAILSLVSGIADTYTVEKDTKVLIGEPEDYPDELVNAVKEKLKQINDVKQAWLLLMVRDEEESFLIVLDHTGDGNEISNAIGNAAVPYLQDKMYLDITTIEQDFGANAVKDKTPFYQRA
jgi:SseB protein.